jgi:REP element-mobilizing transposase RayT
MIRGIERRDIFRDDADRTRLVHSLERLIPLWGGDCFAWVLMANHVHLVLQTGAVPLAWLMRRLNTSFAIRYLFQNRFKSRLVECEEDLLNLIRYVHLNPLRAGAIPDLSALERFPWSGHASLVGARPALGFESVDRALALFDEDPARARRRLRAWMATATGSADEMATSDREHSGERSPRAPHRKAGGSEIGPPPAELIELICAHFSVSRRDLERGARNDRESRARAVIAFVLVVRRGLPLREVAFRVGVSPQAVGRAIERGGVLTAAEEPRPRGWS